ncbi:MAG: aminotransferase class V-fold PLP-dependent enzyme [Planctomycetota bacterium]
MTSLREHWTLHPEVVFLNHGSFGACPRVVLDVQAELRARLEREPVRFMARELHERLDEVRAALGAFLGAAPEDLAFLPNATTGVNSVLRSMDLAPGDEVLFTNHGYNACNNTVRYVCERAGAHPVAVELPFPLRTAEQAVEAVLAGVTDRTRVALIDHVTSATALVLPVERIVAELRERGVETLIDGAHAPGMVALDLDALGAGYYAGNPHKWMCAPKGAAFLHVRRDLQPSVRPAVISHGANEPERGRSRYLMEFDWLGTGDPTAVLSIPAAMGFLGSLLPGGWDELRGRNRALAREGRALLLDALGAEPAAPEDMLGSMAAVTLPAGESDEQPSAFAVDPLQAALYDEERIEVPISAWPTHRSRLLRISAQAYNEPDDYRRLASALAERLA